MQMAITLLQKGRYDEARKQLEVTRKFLDSKLCIIENTELKYKIESELELWFATCLIRQGQYRQAKVELERLMIRKELIPTNLSNEKLILAKAKARRLLALANAYLGDYEEAFQQVEFVKASIASLYTGKQQPARTNLENTETPVSHQSSRILACKYNFQFTEAIIRLLWGDYVEGVKKAKSAHEGFVNQWGQKHFRSLEVTSLYALLLAYNSDAGNAAILCQRTMETMTKVLGGQHPLTLQNMDVLVYIFRTQSRFTEAVDTSNSLCKKVEAALGWDHPQTLRSKCQLGVAKLFCGDYKAAEKILEAVTQASHQTFGAEHPDTLRFRSELAQAYCFSWKLKLAENLALEVLAQQRCIYTLWRRKKPTDRQYPTETLTKVMLRGLLKDVRQDIETLRVHPDLLFTLQLLAKIESKKPESDLSLVQEIHQTVWEGRKSKLGPTHALSLVSEFELAATFRDLGDLKRSQETFERVAKERSKLLGAEHPDTLAARHESLVMEYTIGEKIEIAELESILKLREWQLGRCHPDALQSLLWLFGIQLLLGKETESETADKLLSRLREDPVRNQRLVESLRTTEKVARFYEAQGHLERSAEIFCDILETTNGAGPNIDESLDLSSLRIASTKKLDEINGKSVQV
ncbi:hypothetical protein DL95DRAFT_396949 [Leptodontidium sp. 2 PMI_412]|nr:hypothetical protein DL95DRAFT_396949 [Leptodontidium sp. 2 PMI_412]